MRRSGVTIGLSVALAAALLLHPSGARAASFHGYSNAYESSLGDVYTGISSTRKDVSIGSIPADGCGGPIQGSAVYQTEWIIGQGNTAWVEIGTGHQCSDTVVYWYWGYGSYSGTFYPLGYRYVNEVAAAHTFQIEADLSSGHYYWHFIAGGVTYNDELLSGVSQEDSAGLESYASTATVPAYSITALQEKSSNGSTWVNWAGEDGKRVDPSMCGHWSGAVVWYAAENGSC